MSKITVTMQFDTAEEAAAWLGGGGGKQQVVPQKSEGATMEARRGQNTQQANSVGSLGQNTQQAATAQPALQTAAGPTLDDAKAAFLAAVEACKGKPLPALQAMERVAGAGVRAVSAVDPAKYGELIAEFRKLVA